MELGALQLEVLLHTNPTYIHTLPIVPDGPALGVVAGGAIVEQATPAWRQQQRELAVAGERGAGCCCV